MEKVQKSEGLVCICAECKKVIKMVGNASPAVPPLISHGICPACAERLYGGLLPQENVRRRAAQTTLRGRSGLILLTIS
jgi:hypothetical protein